MINKLLNMKVSHLIMMAILLIIITACSPSPPEPTTISPSATHIPPTATQIPPTATHIPPTATQIPPTATATLLPTEAKIRQPSPRYYISFAFDIESNQIILFGGQTGTDYKLPESSNNETWAYDLSANKWTRMKPSKSPPRKGAASLAYDSESDRVIMFGGCSEDMFLAGDTWAYDYNSNTWTKLSDGPSQHLGGRIAYDAESDRIILFGGLNPKTFDFYADTWAYDYNTDTWKNMQPKVNPPGTNYQAITYDTKADRILIWGGFDMDYKPIGDSLWAYDFNSNTWQELSPGEASHPLYRDYPSMAYDAESDRSILFGGIPYRREDPGTWAYDYNTNTWLEMKPAEEPGEVSRHHLVYISSLDRVFLFGGHYSYSDKIPDLSNQIWVYDYNSNIWENIMPNP
jgi:hypothetical protein